jgi:hypothetical protein
MKQKAKYYYRITIDDKFAGDYNTLPSANTDFMRAIKYCNLHRDNARIKLFRGAADDSLVLISSVTLKFPYNW